MTTSVPPIERQDKEELQIVNYQNPARPDCSAG